MSIAPWARRSSSAWTARNDFWLNEGFADFMAAAYIQQRFGEAAYQQIIDRWHQRVEKLSASGTDHALVFQDWSKPTADDRAVVYIKGAYVLHLLRKQMGEDDFWSGIRSYTRTYRGKSVTTEDFKRSMEHASKQNLEAFFRQWVDADSSRH